MVRGWGCRVGVAVSAGSGFFPLGKAMHNMDKTEQLNENK